MSGAHALTRPIADARAALARGSKSFALSGALLGPRARDDAAVLYAWCRHADDLIDEAGIDETTAQSHLAQLCLELDAIYSGSAAQPLLSAMADLVRRRRIPRDYPHALLDGLAMDARNLRYASLDALDLYAFRVAGVVGLMMCHVLGVRDERCLAAAAHLGMAMQLTNIVRDVAEDLARGRVYLPIELLTPDGRTPDNVADHVRKLARDDAGRAVLAHAIACVLSRAERYYRSAESGIDALGWREAFAILSAARIYRAIGLRLARRNHDAFSGRVVVPLVSKLGIVAGTFARAALGLLRAPWRSTARAPRSPLGPPRALLRFSDLRCSHAVD